MLASKRGSSATAVIAPVPKQHLFAQLNVRVDPVLDARLKRFCQVTQAKQAQAVSLALDAYLKSQGY